MSYIEAHITVQRRDDYDYEKFRTLNKHWKATRFYSDDADGYTDQWFITTRTETSEAMAERLKTAYQLLREEKFDIIRFKTEQTLIDSKLGHTLEDL